MSFIKMLSKQKVDSIARQNRRSSKWFQNRIKEFSKGTRKGQTSRPVIGGLYSFVYDPKFKNSLPHYDIFPMVMPFSISADSFLGVNFHYLPPRLRAVLLDKIVSIHGNKKINDKTKIKLSWGVLNAVAKSSLVSPTVHRYLLGHVRSKIIVIPATEWQMAVMLPLAKFKGASKLQVYAGDR